jgi:hypothetical protein
MTQQPYLQIVCPWADERELRPALSCLTALNRVLMREYKGTSREIPLLYQSGIRYQREPRDKAGNVREAWCTAPVMLERWRKSRVGSDCEDNAAYRAAELQLRGIAAIAIPIRSGVGWHIVVRHPNGEIEDPSRVLGM